MAPPSCSACETPEGHIVCRFFPGPIGIWQGDRCQFLFCYPLPPQQSCSACPNSALTGGYTDGIPSVSEARTGQYGQLGENRHKQYSALLGKPEFRLLKIGCGACGLAETYERLGIEYHGMDLDSRVIEAKRANVSNARHSDFVEAEFRGEFDVITSSQVSEHIKGPARFFANVDELLARGANS